MVQRRYSDHSWKKNSHSPDRRMGKSVERKPNLAGRTTTGDNSEQHEAVVGLPTVITQEKRSRRIQENCRNSHDTQRKRRKDHNGGDWNAQIGRNSNNEGRRARRKEGINNHNEAGKELIEFAEQKEMIIPDKFLRKKH